MKNQRNYELLWSNKIIAYKVYIQQNQGSKDWKKQFTISTLANWETLKGSRRCNLTKRQCKQWDPPSLEKGLSTSSYLPPSIGLRRQLWSLWLQNCLPAKHRHDREMRQKHTQKKKHIEGGFGHNMYRWVKSVDCCMTEVLAGQRLAAQFLAINSLVLVRSK